LTHNLARTLSATRGAAILLNIVIGAGLLSLPGLAEKAAGGSAMAAWVICAAAAAPLVAVFIVLGKRYPDAGGVAAYAQRAFGDFGRRVAAFLLLSAVLFGLPSIALVGGHYLATILPASPFALALVLLIGAVLPLMLPGEGAARSMTVLASGILVAVLVFLAIGLLGMGEPQQAARVLADDGFWSAALAPFAMLFFAFTGWEIGAGIAEEFKNPRRDFPLAMTASFVLATSLYLAVAFVASRTDLRGHYEAPFVVFVQPLLGAAGGAAVAAVAGIIVFANLAGAVWGISRLLFSLGRDGVLPRCLSRTRQGRPLFAVALSTAALVLVLIADRFGSIGLDRMLALAGQNFLILYGLAGASLLMLTPTPFERLLAVLVVAIVVAISLLQGLRLAYPVVIIVLAGVSWLAARRAATPTTG
jgi:amino acid efflux transporter